ncbi:unnamed protein product [Trifolium pratense]|uniref:Uncharacterized protein n=1 Tax=Trifolium pratense TaxID=57577 RepID=A0ACB0L5M4_TRIPR|nr:unnamed protein product [Trifolium pratense]
MDMNRSKTINGLGQSIGTNWKQENCNPSLNQLMCQEKIAQLILIDAGQRCLLRIHQHQLLQEVTISRAILMWHQILGFLLGTTESIQSKVKTLTWTDKKNNPKKARLTDFNFNFVFFERNNTNRLSQRCCPF